MVVDCDRPDVLETIGFRVFAVGTKPLNSEEIPFAYPRDLSHYISEVDTYFITQETFEYFFKNRKTSPNCFDYATSFEFQIVPLKNKYSQRKEYTYTHLHNDIVAMAIKYGMFDVLDKLLALTRKSYIAKISLNMSITGITCLTKQTGLTHMLQERINLETIGCMAESFISKKLT